MTGRNDERAMRAAQVVARFTDGNHAFDGVDGLQVDLADIMADLLHLADAYGVDRGVLMDRVVRTHAGDAEDGPPASAHPLGDLTEADR